MAERDQLADVQRGYTFDVPVVELGALVVDGAAEPAGKVRLARSVFGTGRRRRRC